MRTPPTLAPFLMVASIGLCSHVARAFCGRHLLHLYPLRSRSSSHHPNCFISAIATKKSPKQILSFQTLSSEIGLSSRPPDDNNKLLPEATTTIAASAVALLSILSSLGVFWSEVAVFQTSCGPLSMPDWLERGCYLGVLVVSGLSIFLRIVTFGQSGLADVLVPTENGTEKDQLHGILGLAEGLSALAVVGAIVVLGNQAVNGEAMDGMSGIDLEKCRARQAFDKIQ